jgi:RNA polymerase sigma factor (sigma-70 family)
MPVHSLTQLVGRLRQPFDEPVDADLLARLRRGRDPAAFEAVVRRHGPLVLAACRKVLADPADADDAFQATFLTLLLRPTAVRSAESLGCWLYGVGHRTALRARAAQSRRDRLQAKVAERTRRPQPNGPGDELSWREACGVLHAELDRLADSYRLPLLLCYLEGLTRDEAAARLGCSVDVLRGRLERGREKLRRRLVRRGVTLSAGLLAALAGNSPAADGPSPTLIQATQAAAAGAPSPAVAALVRGVPSVMTSPTVKLLAAAALLAGAVFALARPAAEPPPPPPTAAPPQATAPAESFTYAGRVLDAEGKPIAGAKVHLTGLKPGVIEFVERAVTGPDGAFRFNVRRDEFGDKGVVPPSRSPPERFVQLGATADGHGSVAAWASAPEQRENVTIRLPAEQIVRGRVIDLEGKPIPGVTVAASFRGGRTDAQGRPAPFDLPPKDGGYMPNFAPSDHKNVAVTDADGRVTLRSLGRDWLYELSIRGPTVVNGKAQLVARPAKPEEVQATGIWDPKRGMPKQVRYGSEFTFVATPSKPIRGTVRDKGTGEPIVGARVFTPFTRDNDPQAQTTTDAAGRYELTGLPGGKYAIRVGPPAGTPYLETEFRVEADRPGVEPVTADFALERQATVSGRVTDGATGRPVMGYVEYRPLSKNPALASAPLLAEPRPFRNAPTARIEKGGRFRLAVLPGPGVLLVRAEGDYQPQRLGATDRAVALAADPELIDCRPRPAWPIEWQAYRIFDATAGSDTELSIALAPDRSRPVEVEFHDGKPRDLGALGLHPVGADRGESIYPATAKAVRGLAEGEARRLFLGTQDGKLAAMTLVDGSQASPVTVKLQTTGIVTGRLLDKTGKPLVGVAFKGFFDDGPGRPGVMYHAGFADRIPTQVELERSQRLTGYRGDKMGRGTPAEYTDAAGRFRLTGIVPGVPFDLHAQLVSEPDAKGSRRILGYSKLARPTVQPGQTLDLGDLHAGDPVQE